MRLPCPTLYIYGERKPFLFHSPEWLAELAARPDAQVRGFPCGHCVMVDRPTDFTQCVRDWLASTDA